MTTAVRAALAVALRDLDALVRGLTVRQPWAAHLAHLKDIENRGRRPGAAVGAVVLVHAGLKVDNDAMDQAPLATRHLDVRGAVVAVGRLAGAHHDDDCGGRCSVWAQPGCWHWEIGDRQALTVPVPATGALYLWDPDTALRNQLAAALELPVRIRRERTPGWRLPADAAVVDRTSRFGNPFRIGIDGDRLAVVHAHREWLAGARDRLAGDDADRARERILTDLPRLRGQDLACPCPLGEVCHADEYLVRANLPADELAAWIADVRARVDDDRQARGERPLYGPRQLTLTL